MWQDLWPDRAVDDVPITHVTNGVHVPDLDRRRRCARCSTATSATAGADRAVDPATWAPVDDIPADELWAGAQRRSARR